MASSETSKESSVGCKETPGKSSLRSTVLKESSLQSANFVKSDSPSKPSNEAMEPVEMAHGSGSQKEKTLIDEQKNENENPIAGNEDNSCDDQKTSSIILSKAMLEEEKQIQQEIEDEEDKIREEQSKLWKRLDDESREQRYKRMQFLLSKSNMYTQYLVERMNRQKEEDQKRHAKLEKRRAKMLKKKEERKKQETAKEGVKVEVVSETKADGANPVVSLDSSAVDTTSSKPVLEMRSARNNTSSANNSQDLQSSQDSQATSSSRRGRKRKAETSSTISDFFKPKSVKIKPEEGSQETGSEHLSCNLEADLNSNKSANNETSIEEKVKSKDGCPAKELVEGHKEIDAGIALEQELEIERSLATPSLLTGGKLRSYQIEGFRWLKTLFENGVNGILADEMGLGKTIQCIAHIAHLVAMGVVGPFLIVAPLSTIPNWCSEFTRFAPKVPYILYHGSKEERDRIRRKISKKVSVKKNIAVHPVVITSYEITMRDRKVLQNYDWRYLIVDEGHRLKNTNCRLIRELRMYRNTHRLLLTGTPLQNNLAELWSLLNFLLPEIFDDLGSFETWFDVEHIGSDDMNEQIVAEEQRNNILSMLHQILAPFMLRRVKSDVDLVIPPKKEVLVYAPLTKDQQELYTSLVDKTILQKIQEKNKKKEVIELNEKGRPKRKSSCKKVDYSLMMETADDSKMPSKWKKKEDEENIEAWVTAIMDNEKAKSNKSSVKEEKVSQVTVRLSNIMMQLRKCCNHPYLLEYPLELKTGQFKIDENLVKVSGKMMVLDRMLEALQKRGHKVLIFSQMTKMLDIIEDFCYLRKYGYCRLDGTCNLNVRKEQIEQFNRTSDIFIFLLSTRAGGLGINLTAADTVIIYDSDWNPQCDLQAQDRCHRIGQTKPVVVYRFVTANTIDQKIVERASAKRKLEKMVIHKGKFTSGMDNFNTDIKVLDPEELMALLKSRDHEMEVRGQEGNVISEAELELLLDRRDLYERFQEITTAMKGNHGSPVKKKVNSVSPVASEVSSLFKVLQVVEGRTFDPTRKKEEIEDDITLW
ncbi:hypothetical protein ACJMK2_023167 [Sinanodonta woodiana]|uniref:Proliferation-associated SNF2-like protein n=1 Tax=Sinanodonta woodiana TaxID=1069815 RepID=A0ABD3T471_SINWO